MTKQGKITRTIDVKPTPEELAVVFATMGSMDQAMFFNAIAEEVDSWPNGMGSWVMQLQYINTDEVLTDGARHIMETIGEYAHPEEASR